MWFVVIPFVNGYLGICKSGNFFGKKRIEVINKMLLAEFKK